MSERCWSVYVGLVGEAGAKVECMRWRWWSVLGGGGGTGGGGSGGA